MAGCTPVGQQAIDLHAAGNLQQARASILDTNADARDELLLLAEQGKICLDAGDPAVARERLANASDWCERFAIYEPKTTIVEEAGSIVINQTMRTYRGTYADRIMVDAFAVLASLWLGDFEKAGVYANRVAERQTDAEVEQQKQIEKVRKEMSSWRNGSSEVLLRQVREADQLQGALQDAAYSAYLNPFASWMAAIAWSATGDSGNLGKARTALRQASGMMPGNQVLRQQAEFDPFTVASLRPQVLVLFEACRGMSLEAIMVPFATPWSGFTTIPIPVPRAQPCDVSALSVQGDGAAVSTELLSDNDAIFQAQYDRMLPELILRTAVMVGAKQGATVAATQATRSDSGAQVAVWALMSLYQTLTNQADLRSWRSVGKFTQIAQVDRPAGGVLSVAVVGTGGITGPPASVSLPPGRVVMVYVRAIHAGSTVVYSFTLDGGVPSQASPPTTME